MFDVSLCIPFCTILILESCIWQKHVLGNCWKVQWVSCISFVTSQLIGSDVLSAVQTQTQDLPPRRLSSSHRVLFRSELYLMVLPSWKEKVRAQTTRLTENKESTCLGRIWAYNFSAWDFLEKWKLKLIIEFVGGFLWLLKCTHMSMEVSLLSSPQLLL